ncbi:MAG TPA: hypothetical protein VGM26_08285 [Rhizomicrobium sp.]|jgi:choline-glycine betaine transporter
MKKPPTHHDEDDNEIRAIYRTSYGDIGIVLIAAGCTLAFILMMILPSPVAKLEQDKASAARQQEQTVRQQQQAARQQQIDKAVASGEVSMGIATPQKH